MYYKVIKGEAEFINSSGKKVRASKGQVINIARRIDSQRLLKEKRIEAVDGITGTMPKAVETEEKTENKERTAKFLEDDLATVIYEVDGEEKETVGKITEVRHMDCVVEIQPNSDDKPEKIIVKKKKITVLG